MIEIAFLLALMIGTLSGFLAVLALIEEMFLRGRK